MCYHDCRPHITVEHSSYRQDQFLVLMCDGIWNAMPNKQVVEFVIKHLTLKWPLNKICEEIIRQILPATMPEKGIVGKDNMTVMIVRTKCDRKSPSLQESNSTKIISSLKMLSKSKINNSPQEHKSKKNHASKSSNKSCKKSLTGSSVSGSNKPRDFINSSHR